MTERVPVSGTSPRVMSRPTRPTEPASRPRRRAPSRVVAGALSGAVLLIGLASTALAVDAEKDAADDRARDALEVEASDRATEVADAASDAVAVLEAAAAFQATNGRDVAPFAAFAGRLGIADDPGLSFVSFIVPIAPSQISSLEAERRAAGQPTFTVDPGPLDGRLHVILFSGPNPGPTDGVDVGDVSILPAALDRAGDSGLPVVTDPFVRIQDRHLPAAEQRQSVAMYVPVYADGAATATVDQRRDALLGWTASAVPVPALLSELDVSAADGIRVTLRDADDPTVVLGAVPADAPVEPGRTASTVVDVLGQRWVVEVETLPGYHAATSSAGQLALAGGLGSLAVAALVLNLALQRRRLALRVRETVVQAATNESRFRAIVDNAPVGVLVVQYDGRVLDCNPAMAAMLQVVPDAATLPDVVLEVDVPAWMGAIDHFRVDGRTDHVLLERRMCRDDGSTFWARTTVAALPGEDAVVALVQDVTAERAAAAAAEELRSRRARFEALVRHSTDLISVIGADRKVLYASPAVAAMVGVSPDDAVGTDALAAVHDEDRDLVKAVLDTASKDPGVHGPVRYRMLQLSGGVRWVEATATNLLDDPDVRGIVANCRDVTAHHEAAETLRQRADHDALTGLATREVLLRRVDAALGQARQNGSTVAVLFVDLDRFKQVNDRFGHAAGDALLVDVAGRIVEAVRPGDMVARHGGDEFVVLLESVRGEREARNIAERVRSALRRPVVVAEGVVLEPGASVGVALSDQATTAAAAMLRDADAALYRAKASGRDRVEVFDDELRRRAVRRLDVELMLRQALEDDSIGLRFEPVADLVRGGVVGAEARVRLALPCGELVPLSELLPVAQEAGLASELTTHLLEAACRSAASWSVAADGLRWIGVDVSAGELTHSTFIPRLVRLLDVTGVEPGALRLELPVDVLSSGTSLTRQAIAATRALGVQVVLDGVGAELRSLASLGGFVVDGLKLDLAALPDTVADPVAAAVAASVGEVARAASLPVVVVGADDPAHLAVAHRLGFRYVQGAAVAPISESVDLLVR